MSQAHTRYAGISPAPHAVHALWALALLIGIVAGAAAGGFSAGFAAKRIQAPVADFIVVGGMLGALLLGIAIFYLGFIRRCNWGRRELGFIPPTRSLWHLIWWFPLTVMIGGINAAIIGTSLGLSPKEAGGTATGFHLGPIAAIVLLAGTILIVPFFEEVIFRRVLLDWLATKIPIQLASLLVVLAFTLIHISPAIMVYVVFLGISLVLARLWFSTMWAPFIVHAANNALVTIIALSV
ncbi:CPBP family intramembrane glutamic endopeptidase [Corynebacterium ulcerans]|uniref:CPBP family intramembrane glutamic endopeptidase n=1 Tax=Corynebacterium ulcerans TaxID=65058 RepID=UPI0018D990BE|nr:CPBP family intramembrane glutamic endopeptidase [Corynebacterium ulcerans]MBH5302926.1 CPBP family intramembrane metalloprotease [Corynebacterium ulcerans]